MTVVRTASPHCVAAPSTHSSGATTLAAAERVAAVDAFRGFAVASMIVVNNPGSWGHVYAPLRHAEWHGWTFTDTIFPSFLFICGVALALSIARRRAAGSNGAAIARQLMLRSGVICLVGLALNLVPSFDVAAMRVPGVLQRIGVCIAMATPLALWQGTRGDVALWVAIVAGLAVYSLALSALPVPAFDGVVATGALEPGRDAGSWLDRRIFGVEHLWPQSRTWDPEGIGSTLPAACSLLFGVIAGRSLLRSRAPRRTALAFAVAGLGSLAAGALLDTLGMPINKNLWTPSYCLLMNGWALLALAAFHSLLDGSDSIHLRARARASLLPLTILGVNALFLFACSSLLARLLAAVRIGRANGDPVTLKAWLYAPIARLPLPAETTSLLFAALFALGMFGIAWLMWKKRWFIRV